MLINSVILVLREVLEATVLISVLMALSHTLRCKTRWIGWSVLGGISGAMLLAFNLHTITDSLDGSGQEVVNACLQLLVYMMTLAVVYTVARYEAGSSTTIVSLFMSVAVAVAMIREGAEIYIYIDGFAAVKDYRAAVYLGSAIGAGIGLSVGVLLYAALRALKPQRTAVLCALLLAVIGAGMVMQATMLLEQVDWLPAGQTLWDTSALVSEQSIGGELLYAVFGYESTPGLFQVLSYIGSVALMLIAFRLGRLNRRLKHAI